MSYKAVLKHLSWCFPTSCVPLGKLFLGLSLPQCPHLLNKGNNTSFSGLFWGFTEIIDKRQLSTWNAYGHAGGAQWLWAIEVTVTSYRGGSFFVSSVTGIFILNFAPVIGKLKANHRVCFGAYLLPPCSDGFICFLAYHVASQSLLEYLQCQGTHFFLQ